MQHFLCLVVAMGMTVGLVAQSPSFEDFNKKYSDRFDQFKKDSKRLSRMGSQALP